MMLGRQKGGVFLSYARDDGENFTQELRTRLQGEAPDIVIKQDRILLEGGLGWWQQIKDAIDSVDFLVLVMTRAAFASGNVQKEWRYARQQGVCVYPVKGVPDEELRFSELPRWMSKAHFFDLKKEWESFIAHLRGGCHTPRVPFMAPELPPHFVGRPKEFGELKSLLLRGDRKDPIAISTALRGAGGFGKTTLAAAICHDVDIIESFDGGILWVTLGQKPDLIRSSIELYAGLTDERPAFVNEEDAAVKIAEKLADRTCLLVVDDVWDAAHLKPFLRGGKQCARLFTTRNADVSPPGAARVDVDEMSSAESVALLQAGLPDLNTAKVRDISERLGNWPLALEAARATLRRLLDARDTPAGALRYLETALAKKGTAALPVEGALSASFELLSASNQNRLIELAIFPEDVPIPFAATATLWGLDEFDTKEAAVQIATSSLLRIDLQNGTMGLHDVLRGWLARRAENAAELHSRLIDAWPDWSGLPDDYAWRWLAWHLAQAGRKTDLEHILWDPKWVQAKLKATDVNALIADYEHLKPARDAELMQAALRLSAHVLVKDPLQFASQIEGRLLLHREIPAIRQFIKQVGEAAQRPRLRPLRPTLAAAGGSALRVLEGHTDSVRAVALTADGKRAVSCSNDNTLRVWDLERNQPLRVLEGHTKSVGAVAVTVDGKRAVSGSMDQTLRVWDLEGDQPARILEGHTAWVTAVALTADGKRAVSGSMDQTLRVWDLEGDQPARILEGHTAVVTAVALMADGRRAVSSSMDQTLRVWDLEGNEPPQILEGHTAVVWSVALTADGKRAVSGSNDKTLRVWDLESNQPPRVLEGHTAPVSVVALTADGKRAVSGSDDHTLRIWDLEGRQPSRVLEGHTKRVSAVALTADGVRAVSGSEDTTLRVWDLEDNESTRVLEGHTAWVTAVALTVDGKRAVSGSWDTTLRVWNLESARPVRVLEGHKGCVLAVALTADGKRAVSGSWDTTLRVWDLEGDQAVRVLEGHGDSVNAVALTADGKRAVSGSYDRTLRVWDLESNQPSRVLEGHTAAVWAVALTADGKRAVSGSNDKTLRVWDLEGDQPERVLEGHAGWVSAVAVTTDGKRAVSGSNDKTLRVWDLEGNQPARVLEGHTDSVNALALTADGKRAVSSSYDHTLRVWDLTSGNCLVIFTCDAPVDCCAWSGNLIAAGDRGRQFHLFLWEA
jgi:WD40 repeat protein